MNDKSGVVIGAGAIGWLEQLALLGITNEEAFSYPPGSKKTINIRAFYDFLCEVPAHIQSIRGKEDGI